MIIDKIHREKIKEKSISSSVKNGIAPASKNVKSIINDYLANINPGKCNVDFIDIESYSKSNPQKWNTIMKQIDYEVDTMIKAQKTIKDEINYLGSRITELQDKAVSETQKINQRILNLKEILANSTTYTNKNYIFDDFKNIEFYSDKERNLPSTTAFIDLLNKRVSNIKKDYEFSNISLESASININIDTNGEGSVIGDIKNVIKNNNRPVLISSESNINLYFNAEIEIVLLIPTFMNNIKINLSSVSKIKCSLRIVDEDGITHTLNDIETINLAEWSFIQKKVAKFYITFAADKQSGVTEQKLYTSSFMLNKIEAFNDFFETTSTFVTKAMNFPQILDAVKLEANDVLMPKTNIEYFIAIDNGIAPLNWVNVKNNCETSLNILNEKQEILNNTIPYYGHAINNDCYLIGTLNKHYNSNSLMLLSGYQQWNVEILNSSKFDSNYTLNMNDYSKDKIIERTSIDYESYKINVKQNKMYAMSTIVYCDKEFESKEFYINSNVPKGSTFQTIVIFNHNVVKKTKGTYKFAFRKGKNIINILLFTNKDCSFTHNLNFKTISQNCGHGGKLRQVSESYLKNNLYKNNDEYFCVDSSNNILVKINPLQLSEYFKSDIQKTDFNFQDYTRYYLSYKYLPKENYHLCLKNNIPNTNIRLMAVFNSESIYISPELTSYVLKGR